MATDPVYVDRVRRLSAAFDLYLEGEAAAKPSFGQISAERPVSYFCAEYGVHNSLPLYSGGLGMLAGDHLKSAVICRCLWWRLVLLYRFVYFRQRLRRDGWQEEYYGETHSSDLPIKRIYNAEDTPLLVELMIRERLVKAQVWRADVGRVPLYLLDTNIARTAAPIVWSPDIYMEAIARRGSFKRCCWGLAACAC